MLQGPPSLSQKRLRPHFFRTCCLGLGETGRETSVNGCPAGLCAAAVPCACSQQVELLMEAPRVQARREAARVDQAVDQAWIGVDQR